MKNKRENVLSGIISLLFSQIFIKVIGLLYKLYLTNTEGFGDKGNAIYASGFQIYALLLTFSSTGVPNAISKLVSERLAVGDSRGAHKIFKISFMTFALIGIMGTVLLFFGAEIISEKLIQIPEAKYCLIALAPSLFFVSIGSVIRGYFNGRMKFKNTARSQSLEQLFKTIFTIAFVELVILLIGRNTKNMAEAANLATTVATVFSFIYIFISYRKERKQIAIDILSSVNYKPTRIRKTLKHIIKVAFPISASSLISSFNKNIDSFTIVRFLKKFIGENEAKIQYGILSGKIDMLCTLPLSLNIAFVTALVPNISKQMARKDFKGVENKSKLFILISIIIGMPVTLMMIIFAKQILNLLFPNANSGAMLLRVNAISIIFMILAQTVNGILQGMGKVNVPAIAFGIGMIVKLICNLLLIKNPNIGIYGAVIGNILCNIVAFLIGFRVLTKTFKMKFEIKKFIIKPIMMSIIMSIITIIVYFNLKSIIFEKMATILAFAVGGIIYLLEIIIFRIFPEVYIKPNKIK